jgi:hypothetical protein
VTNPIQLLAYPLEQCGRCYQYWRRHPSDHSGCPHCRNAVNDDPVLGRCCHGYDLDRGFCPHGCRV